MQLFWIAAIAALVVSSIGFKKYIWFISIGYGFAIFAIGVVLIGMHHSTMDTGTLLACILFIVYGLRLGGYLAYRELEESSQKGSLPACSLASLS